MCDVSKKKVKRDPTCGLLDVVTLLEDCGVPGEYPAPETYHPRGDQRPVAISGSGSHRAKPVRLATKLPSTLQ
jgi:hypothetical protein